MVVSRQELHAALLFVSKDAERYVLTGVSVERAPGKQPKIVATDGRRLVVIESVAVQVEECFVARSLLLQPMYVTAFCSLSKACGGKLFPWICFSTPEPGEEGHLKRLTLSLIGSAGVSLDIADGALIDGEYPDWSKVIPKRTGSREPMNDLGLNSAYMGDFAVAAKRLGAESPLIQMNLVGKEQAVEVKLPSCPNFYGLVSKCLVDEKLDYQPEFVSIVKDVGPKPAPEAEETTEPQTESPEATEGEAE